MAENEELIENDNKQNSPIIFPNPLIFFTKLISLQTQIISTTIVSLASPFFSIISLISDPFHRRPLTKEQFGGGGSLFFRRIAVGLLAAAYVCMVLVVVMVIAAVVGVGLVRLSVEEPVYVKESLQFDYTEAHPTAVFSFGCKGAVPVGHTLYVSLLLLMPDSDYNREVGIFQLTAEIVSTGGDLMPKSSHPCMLKFRSWPIRYARTFLMGIPLLLGITTETQTITFPILKHKEASYSRTEKIRIILIPRAGTCYLPQFCDAVILIKSRPNLIKEFICRWKWTLYVWTTFYIFLLLVMILVLFLKPLILPVMRNFFEKPQDNSTFDVVYEEPHVRDREEREVSESLRRLQLSRKKRRAALLQRLVDEPDNLSASSIMVSREETGGSFEEGSSDTESVCFRGFD